MSQRVILCSEVKPQGGAVAKASLNRAYRRASGVQLHGVDPKPGDLPMARVKRE
jgi:hypothetical protein